ncbi:MAG: aldehyde ferredoxin oxidoreductase N-terminal domain-containing protein [Candidatus Heimdallarchaeota archaeon]
MTLYGSTGKILEVNLTKNKISTIPPNKSDYKNYIGGSGLATKLLYPDFTKDLDPLSPENPLGFFNGPLVGTRTPNCGRHVVIAKSPATNIFGESNSGGKFGTYLKFLGYDGLIFRGKAEEPVSLTIIDEDINIESAKDHWGKNVFEVEKFLNEKYNKVSSFATIGVAGENLVKIAALMNDGDRAAGRTGLGAVMGSKNLKSIMKRN